MASNLVSGYGSGGSQFSQAGVPSILTGMTQNGCSVAVTPKQSVAVGPSRAAHIGWSIIKCMGRIGTGKWCTMIGCILIMWIGHTLLEYGPEVYEQSTQWAIDTAISLTKDPPKGVIVLGEGMSLFLVCTILQWLAQPQKEKVLAGTVPVTSSSLVYTTVQWGTPDQTTVVTPVTM